MPEIDSVQGAFTSKSQVLAAPRRVLHPAWVMLGIGTLGMFLSAPGQSFSVAAFIDPMLGDLGLLRTDYSIAYLIAGLVGGALLPGIGLLLDRLGARVLLPLLGLLLGFACLWMSSIGTLLGLSIGFTLIRSIGQGAITLSATWLVGEWFENRRGLAMGIVGLGGAVSLLAARLATGGGSGGTGHRGRPWARLGGGRG